MTLDVHLFPCLSDNYGFLIRDQASGVVATVDTPDAEAIMAALKETGWGRLDMILNTHWHPDHTQGNDRLKTEFGCEIVGPEEVRRAAPLDRVIGDGDQVAVGETVFDVSLAPGHTLGHVTYHAPKAGLAFVGDVIFALGCGRLFEGTPEQMFASLQAIGQWSPDIRLYCAHEYTESNARFALSHDDRPQMKAHAEAIFAARARGEATVPTTLKAELEFNPFLRAKDAEEFASRRRAKDSF